MLLDKPYSRLVGRTRVMIVSNLLNNQTSVQLASSFGSSNRIPPGWYSVDCLDWLFKSRRTIVMSDNIANARRRRGILHGHLTRIERDIAKLELKEELTQQDHCKAERDGTNQGQRHQV